MIKRANSPFAIFLFAVAVIYLFQHHAPLSLKLAIVTIAHILGIHLLNEYSPRAARWITATTILAIIAIIRGVLSVGNGSRR